MVEHEKKDDNKINEVSFHVSSRFSQLIGRQLISNPIIAVLELVKNSYDADAKKIDIIFSDLLTDNKKLIISDNGCGMTIDDINNKWMLVGTADKLINTKTDLGRRKLGEKGIGRFSVERLAEKTTIISTIEDSDEEVEIFIDWNKYNDINKFFTDIKHPVNYKKVDKSSKGTTIILERLRDNWTEDYITNLRKELYLLKPLSIGSLSSNFSQDVDINFSCNDFPTKSGKIELNLLKYYQTKLFGQILESGDVKLELELKVNKRNSNKETLVKYTRFLKKEEVNYTCGPVLFEAYGFMRDGRLYKGLEVNSKTLANMLDEYGGIKIYRDEFRIKPYGDSGNDWLDLNSQKSKDPEYRLGSYQIIGGVKIERDKNPGLQDVLSRENLYETVEFNDLKKFINSIFEFYHYASFVEIRNHEKEQRDIRTELYTKLLESSDDLKKTVNEKKVRLETHKNKLKEIYDSQPKEVVSKNIFEDAVKKVNKIIQDVEEDYNQIENVTSRVIQQADETSKQIKSKQLFEKREMQIYRNIASLGISAAQFGHETEKLVINAVLSFGEIKSYLLSEFSCDDLILREANALERYLSSINEKVDFFRGYLKREKQDKEEDIYPIIIFKTVTDDFYNSFDKISAKIDIINNEEVDIKIKGYYGDFESIITNIVTNAYKALNQSSDSDKYLKIEFKMKENKICIDTINNGKPIEKEDREHIFEPMFTTNKDGTGLGLTIISDTLKEYGGNIRLSNDYPETHFRIEIPIENMGDING